MGTMKQDGAVDRPRPGGATEERFLEAGRLIVGSAPGMISTLYDMPVDDLAGLFAALYADDRGIYSHNNAISIEEEGGLAALAVCFDRKQREKENEITADRILERLGPAKFFSILEDLKRMGESCGKFPGDAYYVANVSVREDLRGRGLGSKLFGLIEEKAKSIDLRRLALDVEMTNERGLKFYRRLGFRELEIRDHSGTDKERFTRGFVYLEKTLC